VGDDVGEGGREEDERENDKAGHAEPEAPAVTADRMPVQAAAPPQGRDPRAQQDDAGSEAEQSREVVSGRRVRAGVVERLAADEDPEPPRRERNHGLGSRPHPRQDPCAQAEQRDWNETPGEVIQRGSTGLRLEQVVVGDVDRDDGQGEVGEAAGEAVGEHAPRLPADARLDIRDKP
jgi:hypothetical protein